MGHLVVRLRCLHARTTVSGGSSSKWYSECYTPGAMPEASHVVHTCSGSICTHVRGSMMAFASGRSHVAICSTGEPYKPDTTASCVRNKAYAYSLCCQSHLHQCMCIWDLPYFPPGAKAAFSRVK